MRIRTNEHSVKQTNVNDARKILTMQTMNFGNIGNIGATRSDCGEKYETNIKKKFLQINNHIIKHRLNGN